MCPGNSDSMKSVHANWAFRLLRTLFLACVLVFLLLKMPYPSLGTSRSSQENPKQTVDTARTTDDQAAHKVPKQQEIQDEVKPERQEADKIAVKTETRAEEQKQDKKETETSEFEEVIDGVRLPQKPKWTPEMIPYMSLGQLESKKDRLKRFYSTLKLGCKYSKAFNIGPVISFRSG